MADTYIRTCVGMSQHVKLHIACDLHLFFILPISCNAQLPVTAIREMKILNELSHPSMVRLLEIVTSVGEVNEQGCFIAVSKSRMYFDLNCWCSSRAGTIRHSDGLPVHHMVSCRRGASLIS